MPREYITESTNYIAATYASDTVGTFRVLVCSECGQPVARHYIPNHDAFHNNLNRDHLILNELSDWAKNISKLFSTWIFKGVM